MKTEPLLGAAAFGAVAAVLYNLVNTLIAVQSPAFEGLGMGLNCFVGLVIALVAGFLYASLHRREAPLTAGVGAKGGLATGALAFAINGAVSVVIAMLLGPQMMATTLAAGGFTEPLDTGAVNAVLLGGALVLQCAGVVFGALASAAGGAVGAALLGSQQAGSGAPDPARR